MEMICRYRPGIIDNSIIIHGQVEETDMFVGVGEVKFSKLCQSHSTIVMEEVNLIV